MPENLIKAKKKKKNAEYGKNRYGMSDRKKYEGLSAEQANPKNPKLNTSKEVEFISKRPNRFKVEYSTDTTGYASGAKYFPQVKNTTRTIGDTETKGTKKAVVNRKWVDESIKKPNTKSKSIMY